MMEDLEIIKLDALPVLDDIYIYIYMYIYIYIYIYTYIYMVFITEGFFDVAIESLAEWDLNTRPLNSVQTL